MWAPTERQRCYLLLGRKPYLLHCAFSCVSSCCLHGTMQNHKGCICGQPMWGNGVPTCWVASSTFSLGWVVSGDATTLMLGAKQYHGKNAQHSGAPSGQKALFVKFYIHIISCQVGWKSLDAQRNNSHLISMGVLKTQSRHLALSNYAS